MKQPEDLADEPRKRGTEIGFLVAVVVIATILSTALFMPLLQCTYCGKKRQEIHDWLREPYLQKYREDHPEAVAAALADIDKINQDCGNCFHGRITLGSELKGLIWGHSR